MSNCGKNVEEEEKKKKSFDKKQGKNSKMFSDMQKADGNELIS